MSCSLHDSLKTDIDDKQDHVLVFTTNRTLHDRFKPKLQTSVFMLKNGYTAPFKNTLVKGRIVFPNKKTNKIHSSFGKKTFDENIVKTQKDLIQLAKNRRVVYMPAKLDQKSVVECIDDKILPLVFKPEGFGSSPPQNDLTSGKSNFIGKRYSSCSETSVFSPVSLSGQNHNFRQSLINSKRIRISKDQLDDEIDAYMAEVKLTTVAPNKEDEAAFIQEYFMETEKSLQEN